MLSATLIAALVFVPAALAMTAWMASGLTLGVVAGYLAYALCHHGTHHWRAERRWFKERKLWHALHHRARDKGQCYGVTTTFWDRVFRTVPNREGDEPSRQRRPDDVHCGSAAGWCRGQR